MDPRLSAKEFGFFEACLNIEKYIESEEVRQQVGAYMPLPDKEVEKNIKSIANWLKSLGKTKYFFLLPEIALIDELVKIDGDSEIIISIPCNMEPDVRERLENNLPNKEKTTLLEEPFTLKGFFPSDSIIVVCGYFGGGRAMVIEDTYRMAKHYKSSFYGKVAFVPYAVLDSAVRYDGWRELSKNIYNEEWRGEE